MSQSSGTAPAHKSVSSIRPTPSVTAGTPGSPHTPLRTISSNFGSPSALRAEEECIVLEIGARYLRIGFAGDAVPKSVVHFGPEEQRRAGDYRQWDLGYEGARREHTVDRSWGESYELWRPDLRGLELGLIGDKIERAIREAYSKYLLIDSRPRRMLLALPTAFPLPLLSTILDTLFINFQPPNISLLSAPALTTVAAGVRSSLVVDIGWAETVVTAIYEYREVGCQRSIRGSKMLGEEYFKMIANSLDFNIDSPDQAKSQATLNALPSFAECEDIIARVAWCNPGVRTPAQERRRELTPVNEEDELRASTRSLNISDGSSPTATCSILLSSTKPPKTLSLPFSDLTEPCEKVLLGKGQSPNTLDDEELPLHLLIYQALLQLPVDVRSICMSRVIFVGGGSKITGLKSRLLNDVANLIDERGWDRVQGKAYDEYRLTPKIGKTKPNQLGPAGVSQNRGISQTTTPTISAALLEQENDPIEEQLKRETTKRAPFVESGNIRAVESLGAWAGGSLVSQLRIPAVSVVDRDQWVLHGAAGASRGSDGAGGGSRQSLGSTNAFNKPGAAAERNSWTLGLWA